MAANFHGIHYQTVSNSLICKRIVVLLLFVIPIQSSTTQRQHNKWDVADVLGLTAGWISAMAHHTFKHMRQATTSHPYAPATTNMPLAAADATRMFSAVSTTPETLRRWTKLHTGAKMVAAATPV